MAEFAFVVGDILGAAFALQSDGDIADIQTAFAFEKLLIKDGSADFDGGWE